MGWLGLVLQGVGCAVDGIDHRYQQLDTSGDRLKESNPTLDHVDECFLDPSGRLQELANDIEDVRGREGFLCALLGIQKRGNTGIDNLQLLLRFRNRKGLIGLSGAHRNYGGNRGSMSCRSRESCRRHQGTNNQRRC